MDPYLQSEQALKSQTSLEDDPGFERLFSEHWESIYRLLFRLTGCPDEAEDLALETFLRFWQRPPRETHSLGGWLYRVAANLGYNALRASRRRRWYETRPVHEPVEPLHPSNPAALVELQEDHRQIRAILSTMSSRQAKLLVLRHSGLSYKEVAEALGIPVSSVGTLLLRAEKEFLKRYQSEVEHDALEG